MRFFETGKQIGRRLAIAAGLVAAVSLGVAPNAAYARGWHGGGGHWGHHGGGHWGGGVALGILGGALAGAAIASGYPYYCGYPYAYYGYPYYGYPYPYPHYGVY